MATETRILLPTPGLQPVADMHYQRPSPLSILEAGKRTLDPHVPNCHPQTLQSLWMLFWFPITVTGVYI